MAITIAIALAVLVSAVPLTGEAAGDRGHRNTARPGEVLASWTADELAAAVPLPLPLPVLPLDAGRQPPTPEGPATPGESHGEDGRPPTAGVAPDGGNRLYRPRRPIGLEPPVPFQAAPFGAVFTSSRLIPLSADRSYPYRAVGRLVFRKVQGGDPFVCSASVIKPRVIVTAGHCVHSGDVSPGYFRDFVFTPALRDGIAPFKAWEFERAVATRAWRTGGGGFPSPADYAVITLRDRTVNGSLKKIGAVTGFLGFQTLSLHPNHVHILGYPVGFDNGARMHQVTTTSVDMVSPNNVRFASDMTGGSSGGPFIQNFGKEAQGQEVTGANRVVGVISAGTPALQSTVASIPDHRFVTILNIACDDRPGNC
jgi:V8-like Glu-specific endopeptidase